MNLKFYKNGYSPDKKYFLYKKIENQYGVVEYYKEIIETKTIQNELNDINKQLELTQRAIDSLILNKVEGGE